MEESNNNLIPYSAITIFNQIYAGLSTMQREVVDRIKEQVLGNIGKYSSIRDFRKPVERVEDILLKRASKIPQNEQFFLRRALIAKLALELPRLIASMDLPNSVLTLFPDAFIRLSNFLTTISEDPYNSKGEFFCKDIRFVLGLSIPCGSLYVDMNSCVTILSVLFSVLRSRELKGLIHYISANGMRTWFRGHLDSRYTTEFNEKDFECFYLRVSELLKGKQEVAGYVGTSWLYDPQLLKISPHLSFFQERPRERGAFFLKHGTQSSDVVNAIKTSESRRRLYQHGKYKPICYSSLWPRDKLILWAEQVAQKSRLTDM